MPDAFRRGALHPKHYAISADGTFLMEKTTDYQGYCKEGDRCVCGGDTPRVRAGCGNWVRTAAMKTATERADEQSLAGDEQFVNNNHTWSDINKLANDNIVVHRLLRQRDICKAHMNVHIGDEQLLRAMVIALAEQNKAYEKQLMNLTANAGAVIR